jgi:hypothetical protein
VSMSTSVSMGALRRTLVAQQAQSGCESTSYRQADHALLPRSPEEDRSPTKNVVTLGSPKRRARRFLQLAQNDRLKVKATKILAAFNRLMAAPQLALRAQLVNDLKGVSHSVHLFTDNLD